MIMNYFLQRFLQVLLSKLATSLLKQKKKVIIYQSVEAE